MPSVLRIPHLRIAHQGAILRWTILTFTGGDGDDGDGGGGGGGDDGWW